MPFVNIRIVKEVLAADPDGRKAEIGRRVVAAVSEVAGVPEDVVWVVFEEVDAQDWYVGRRSVQEMRAQKP
jgi:4-oxalocrotonate tautomerase